MPRYPSDKCPSCGGIPAPDRKSCQKCLDCRKQSRLNKKPGICSQCPELTVPGKLRCVKCAAIATQRQLLKRSTNLTDGLCRCDALPKPGCKNCQSCLDKAVVRRRNQMKQLRTIIFEHYGNKCTKCGTDRILNIRSY